MPEKPSPFSFRRWWRLSGLAGAANAGRGELDSRGMNALIYECPTEGVTVIVAREGRADQLRAAWNEVFEPRSQRLVPHLVALAHGQLHTDRACATCRQARELSSYPPDWGADPGAIYGESVVGEGE